MRFGTTIWYNVVTQSQSIDIVNTAVESLTGCFSIFAQTPETGTRRDDIEVGLRGFPAGKYIIHYRESGGHVVISRVK